MFVERITTPSGLPFDPDSLVAHVRVDSAAQIAEATRHGASAAAELERVAQLALLTQTIRVTLDGWPDRRAFALPIGPVLDGADVSVSADGVALSGFELMPGDRPALVLVADPTTALMAAKVVITYQAGFGATAAAVPLDLQLAIMDQAAATFDERGLGVASPHMARIAGRYRRVAL